jgi:Fe2+/Zn2+ uptake regulation proteins
MRYSKQREEILNIVKMSDNHGDANYIYKEVRKKIPNISLGTVYRNLNSLVETGEILKISGLEEKEHYDKTLHNHIHMICKVCKEVFDYHNYDFEKLDSDIKKDLNFISKEYSFTITGICYNCQKKEEK